VTKCAGRRRRVEAAERFAGKKTLLVFLLSHAQVHRDLSEAA
jgi:hypothetical protein